MLDVCFRCITISQNSVEHRNRLLSYIQVFVSRYLCSQVFMVFTSSINSTILRDQILLESPYAHVATQVLDVFTSRHQMLYFSLGFLVIYFRSSKSCATITRLSAKLKVQMVVLFIGTFISMPQSFFQEDFESLRG